MIGCFNMSVVLMHTTDAHNTHSTEITTITTFFYLYMYTFLTF